MPVIDQRNGKSFCGICKERVEVDECFAFTHNGMWLCECGKRLAGEPDSIPATQGGGYEDESI